MLKDKTVEQIYQKKTPLEHILLRPDTYVGTVQRTKQAKWVLPKNEIRFSYKQITYTPGFYKIFDQVLVNASDNYQRDKKMNQLRVQINPQKGYITIMNNGKGIPVVIHKQHKIYVPELIFGHLLTGSNYNDDERRVVGGRNGYGAKLANVFSDKFIVQCGNSQNKKKFKMTWKKNMTMHDEPQVISYTGKDFVSVTFYPCFKKFNMENGLDEDVVALMFKRVYDMAGLMPKVKVSLNDKQIDVKSFSEYVDLYFDKQASPTKIFDRQVNNQRWQIIVSITEGQFRQVSFVNGVCTSKGGTHVNYLVDQLVQRVQDKIKKKQKDLNIKPFQIKAHIWVFINCLVQNPTFDTQTKETLTLKPSQFGSKCQLSDKMIKEFLKLGIVETVIQIAKAKQMTKLAKTTACQKKSKLTGVPKLQDANEAGTRNSDKCTLILTEGDSAKALAMSGLAVLGRDYYGVFPLKGKLLNVRDANTKILMANQQIQNLLKIIGLQIGKQYQDLKSLRYGAIMIMSDQDTDGSHIKGLVINFVHSFWPTLFKMDGFVKQFITPLIKVFKGTQNIAFYTMNDYKVWAQTVQNIKTWRIKYYKGLGTSTDKQAREYFQDLRKHKIDFQYIDGQDDEAMELIFSKKRVQSRKVWLSNYDPNIIMVYDRPKIRYKQFVDRQFIHFSNEDNNRSIASLVDGFKPGQRKILFGCFKRKLQKELKVAQLAGYIAQNSAYHHGQVSLVETIVAMAQNFVGSNNVNLLMPNGQFGSRNLGGKDHASARYIFTNLNKVARLLFPEADDHTLNYLEDDGQLVEPQFYVPIIPMILVNGCQGIGTGWSTSIPNYNPRQICEIIKKKLTSTEQLPEIHPWYKNFTGGIQFNEERAGYQITGSLYIDENKQNTVIINQLPVGKWTKDYKLSLDDIMNEGEEKIVGLREYHTKDRVHFEVQMNQNFFNTLSSEDGDLYKFQKYFKLTTGSSIKNMVGFTRQSKLARMPNTRAILDMFYGIRMEFYHKRKDYLRSRLVRQLVQLKERQRFIVQVVEQKIMVRNVKKIKLCQTLKQRKYIKYSQFPKVKTTKAEGKPARKQGDPAGQQQKLQGSQEQEEQNDEDQTQVLSKEYNYLLDMPIWNLTYQKVQDIKEKRKRKQAQLDLLDKTSVEDIWISDIDEFVKMLDKVQQKEKIERAKEDEQMKKNLGKGKVQKAMKKKQKKQKQKKQYDWDKDQSQETQTPFGQKDNKQKKQRKIENDSKKTQQTNKKVKKQGKNPKAQKQKQLRSEKSQKQPEDFLARIKKRQAEPPDQYLTTKPVSKQATLEQIFSKDKNKKQYQYDMVPNPNKSKNDLASKKSSRKKMILDSDQEEQEYSEIQDGSAEEGESQDFLNY